MQPQYLIHPVILCGGSGTRLWPVSRQAFPKQFSHLVGSESLFQSAVRRLTGPGFAAPVIVTAAEFRFIVRDQLAELGVVPAAILIEPEARNTGPAILAATLWLQANAPPGLVLVAPSDHLITAPGAFREAVALAAPRAAQGAIVTFGIAPEKPETGYGYLELASGIDAQSPEEPVQLRRFIEKPDAARAAAMVASGRHLWNAGIFLFRADVMITAFNRLAPEIVAPVQRAVDAAAADLGFVRLEAAAWAAAPAVSIDYAVMEKADELWVMPYRGSWSDLGGWDAIWGESARDGDGVASQGAVTALGCRNSLLRSEDDGITLVAIGLEDIVAVAMPDAVLIARKSECQKVKDVVAGLRQARARQADAFRRDHRPWGWFECLSLGQRFQVKRIVVHPGAALSLQSHHHRSEHWIVVEGTAKVTIGTQSRIISENQSVYIPLGEKHRLENPGRVPMALIEVQTGAYLGEDDIIRYEDVYARG